MQSSEGSDSAGSGCDIPIAMVGNTRPPCLEALTHLQARKTINAVAVVPHPPSSLSAPAPFSASCRLFPACTLDYARWTMMLLLHTQEQLRPPL